MFEGERAASAKAKLAKASPAKLVLAESKKYVQHFHCIGNIHLPVTPQQFSKKFMESGWPKDEHVFKDKRDILTEADCLESLRGRTTDS